MGRPKILRSGPCEKCGSNETYTRPNGKKEWKITETGVICKSCSSKNYASRKYVPHPRTPLSGPCVECKSETTYKESSGYYRWYRGPHGTICKKCFNRKNDHVLKSGLCVKCGIAYTKHGWHKTVKGDICQTCYRSNYSKSKRKGNCSICKITEHKKWAIHNEYGRICGTCSHSLVVKEIKKETLSHYSKGKLKCAICGYNKNINGLELDHIEGKGSKDRKEIGLDGGWGFMEKLKKLGFPPGYQVLCATCNKIKQIEVDPKGI